MRIAGLVKNSLLDYPGLIAAVVFVPGCNMDCWYCHNRGLWNTENRLDAAEVFAFLEKRKAFLDGVVISGGEPTLQEGLPPFVRRVKRMGYRVKLDTNGLKPDVVARLLRDVDYVSMDIKAPPGQLHRAVSIKVDDAPVWQCAELLMASGIDYEFRTTFMPTLASADIEAIARRVSGARRYVLQQYRKTGDRVLRPEPHSPETIKKAAKAAARYIENVVIRGL